MFLLFYAVKKNQLVAIPKDRLTHASPELRSI